jgi:hypothetical protein
MLSSAVLSKVCGQQSMRYFWVSKHRHPNKLEITEQTPTVNAIKHQLHCPTLYSNRFTKHAKLSHSFTLNTEMSFSCNKQFL